MKSHGLTRIPEPGSGMAAAVTLLLFLAVTSGCTTSRIDVTRHTKSGVEPDTGVVILARKQDGGQKTEESFMECLTNKLTGRQLPVDIYPQQTFVDKLFPWFESRTAPTIIEQMPMLLKRPGVSEAIAETGVRYIVWVDGNSEEVDSGGGLSCAVGPGGGGCLGLVWWDTASAYETVIWDIEHTRSIGAVSADASGMSYVPALLIPVPLLARTEAAACSGLASQLVEFFIDGGTPSAP